MWSVERGARPVRGIITCSRTPRNSMAPCKGHAAGSSSAAAAAASSAVVVVVVAISALSSAVVVPSVAVAVAVVAVALVVGSYCSVGRWWVYSSTRSTSFIETSSCVKMRKSHMMACGSRSNDGRDGGGGGGDGGIDGGGDGGERW